MKFKYVLVLSILVILFLRSGLLNSIVLPQTNSISPEPTFKVIQVAPTPESAKAVNQRSSMGWKEFYDTIIYSRDLTDLQKENLYVNKIFTWTGQVKEVTQDTVNIQNEYCNGEGINRLCRPIYVNLHVENDQKPKLISLSKGSKISFEGTITKLNLWFDNIDMYNGKIIN
jgi:hypothetical protein